MWKEMEKGRGEMRRSDNTYIDRQFETVREDKEETDGGTESSGILVMCFNVPKCSSANPSI